MKGLTMDQHGRPRVAKMKIDSITNHMDNIKELFGDANFIELAGSKGSIGERIRQTLVILNDDLRIVFERFLGFLVDKQ